MMIEIPKSFPQYRYNYIDSYNDGVKIDQQVVSIWSIPYYDG